MLDHGFTKLYCNWDDAGTARYVVNATVWLLALEHKTRIGVPLTARAVTKDPCRKITSFNAAQLELTSPSLSELLKKMMTSTNTENPVRVTFRIAEPFSDRIKESNFDRKIEWSKSKGTDQRRPLKELEQWAISKKTGHFYLYFS